MFEGLCNYVRQLPMMINVIPFTSFFFCLHIMSDKLVSMFSTILGVKAWRDIFHCNVEMGAMRLVRFAILGGNDVI
jgi:hypothetical protein